MKALHLLGFALFAAILVAVPFTSGNEYELRLFMLFLIYGLIAVGLNVLVGLTGLVSLGQAGLFALGSYAGAILAIRLGLDLVLASLGAAVVAGVFGAALAYPSVRVRGVYLAVVTIAFGLIVENVAIEWQGADRRHHRAQRHPRPEPTRLPPYRVTPSTPCSQSPSSWGRSRRTT